MDPLDTPQQGLGLRHYLDVFRRRKWIVLGVLAVCVGAAVAASVLREPVYEAEAKIVVGQGNSLFQPGEARAIEPFTATMRELIVSNVVASRVIEELNLDMTPTELLANVDVSFNPDTAVLNVDVLDEDPERARQIADTIGTVFSDLVDERFGSQPNPTVPGEAAQPPLTARVWDPAEVEPDPVSPRPKRDIVVAFVLGLVLGLLAAFLRDYFDRTLRTRADVEASFGAPVIGQIPFPRGSRSGAVEAFWQDFREGAEAFRGLRANLQYLALQRPLRTILIASAAPEQGKTTVASNLAVAMAQSGARPVVVEGDLRRPRLHETLRFGTRTHGLTSVLVGASDLDEAIAEAQVPGGEVAVLPSGPLPPNPSELVASAQMEMLLEQLAERYDYVLVDSPPILLVADALELARFVDGVILVVRRNRASTDEAREVRSVAERLDFHVLGAVFTDVSPLGTYYGTYGTPVDEPVPVDGNGAVATPARPARSAVPADEEF